MSSEQVLGDSNREQAEALIWKANETGRRWPGWDCDGSSSICETRLELLEEFMEFVQSILTPASEATQDDTEAVEKAATEFVNRKHPAWHDNGVGIVQGSHYRSGFVAGAVWQSDQARRSTPATREEIARTTYTEGAYCGQCSYEGWDDCEDCRSVNRKYADALLARFTVTRKA